MPGSIDFTYDVTNDIVVSRPRWKLDTSVEVMRWYQMHASYFGGRFQDKRDLIVLNDSFDVVPKVATLWGQYRAKLLETYVRLSVRVDSNPRVRLTTNTSAARYSISALECRTLEEAVKAILGARLGQSTPPASISQHTPSQSFSATNGFGSGPASTPAPTSVGGAPSQRGSSGAIRVPSSLPPKSSET